LGVRQRGERLLGGLHVDVVVPRQLRDVIRVAQVVAAGDRARAAAAAAAALTVDKAQLAQGVHVPSRGAHVDPEDAGDALLAHGDAAAVLVALPRDVEGDPYAGGGHFEPFDGAQPVVALHHGWVVLLVVVVHLRAPVSLKALMFMGVAWRAAAVRRARGVAGRGSATRYVSAGGATPTTRSGADVPVSSAADSAGPG